jgi:DNA polymerase
MALLDQFEGWLQAEKEQGNESVAANPALVRSLKDPILAAPPAAPPAAPTGAAPASPLILFAAGPPASEEIEQLLARMITALGLSKTEMVLLRAGNASGGSLQAQIAALKPAAVVTFGEEAWREAAGPGKESLAAVRGSWQTLQGAPVMPTFGPADLVAEPADKKKTWQDLQAVLAKLGRTPPPARK